ALHPAADDARLLVELIHRDPFRVSREASNDRPGRPGQPSAPMSRGNSLLWSVRAIIPDGQVLVGLPVENVIRPELRESVGRHREGADPDDHEQLPERKSSLAHVAPPELLKDMNSDVGSVLHGTGLNNGKSRVVNRSCGLWVVGYGLWAVGPTPLSGSLSLLA